jgi:hypothetical protein
MAAIPLKMWISGSGFRWASNDDNESGDFLSTTLFFPLFTLKYASFFVFKLEHMYQARRPKKKKKKRDILPGT